MDHDGLKWKGVRREDPERPRPLADAVLRLIWEEKQISRAQIAKQAGLSRSTVSEVVSELLPTGLVAETGTGVSRGGRRPIILEFCDQAAAIVGVDMGAAHIGVALTDLRGRVRAWQERDHDVRDDPEGTRALIAELVHACLASLDDQPSLVGIGVAVPSPVDPSRPGSLSEEVLPHWEGRLGLEDLSEELGVPLWVDNDANLGALAEHWWGAGRGVDDFAYVKVATGVGCGYVLGGELYRGATGVAGEIGHLPVASGKKECSCGLTGCLVTEVGAPALMSRAVALRGTYPESSLVDGPLSIGHLEHAARAGDPLACQVITEAAGHLGIALAGLLNLLNPALVVLGGDLARLGDLLLEPIHETIRSRTLVNLIQNTEMRVSELGPRAVAIGAATLVLQEALADCSLLPATGAATPE